MSDLNHDNELLNFIDSKIRKKKFEYDKIFYLYVKIIKLSLVKTYSNFKSIQYSLSCLHMVINIFFIILSYSNNSKLTMFLSERAIILFIEYINLSNDLNYYDDINLLDVKLFIYKKTIGPLKLKNKNKIDKDFYYLSSLYKDFIINNFRLCISNSLNSEKINVILGDIYKVSGKLFYQFYLDKSLNKLEDIILESIFEDKLYENINLINYNIKLYLYLNDNNISNMYYIYQIKDRSQITNNNITLNLDKCIFFKKIKNSINF
jgi:hypothetical protein